MWFNLRKDVDEIIKCKMHHNENLDVKHASTTDVNLLYLNSVMVNCNIKHF